MNTGKKKPNRAERLERLPQGFGIEWTSYRTFRLSGYEFALPTSFGHFDISVKAQERYEDNVFFLGKTPDIIQRYINFFRDAKPKKIVELGVFRGGSVAFMQLIGHPERLLALELATERQEFLDRFLETEGLNKSVFVEYGVDQADCQTVARLTKQFVGEGRCLDCVLDDASHLLSPTRSSFETLFPLLRPGGTYVIEDFAAAQMAVAAALKVGSEGEQAETQLFNKILDFSLQADNQPLHLMAVEALLASIAAPGIVSRVIIDRHWLRIVRGHEDINPAKSFDLRALACDRFGLLDTVPDNELQRILSARELLSSK